MKPNSVTSWKRVHPSHPMVGIARAVGWEFVDQHDLLRGLAIGSAAGGDWAGSAPILMSSATTAMPASQPISESAGWLGPIPSGLVCLLTIATGTADGDRTMVLQPVRASAPTRQAHRTVRPRPAAGLQPRSSLPKRESLEAGEPQGTPSAGQQRTPPPLARSLAQRDDRAWDAGGVRRPGGNPHPPHLPWRKQPLLSG
jgi:hypothetical protein